MQRDSRSVSAAPTRNEQMPTTITCFKAYDIRGQIPNQLNPDVAYRIGNATAEFLGAKRVVVGRDMRLSSAELTDAVVQGLTPNVVGFEACDGCWLLGVTAGCTHQ